VFSCTPLFDLGRIRQRYPVDLSIRCLNAPKRRFAFQSARK
jgi:hypothetical protein